MPKILLDFIVTPDGGELFVPAVSRLEAAKRRAEARASELRRVASEMAAAVESPPEGTDPDELMAAARAKAAEADAIEADVESVMAANRALREKYEAQIVPSVYEFRPYTDGEKTDALAAATDYSTGTPRLDPAKYQRLLVAASTGFSDEEIRGFSPARAEALVREVVDRSEPDPARLDFLF